MAEKEAARSIQDALNTIVNTIDQSGNMRKDLKKTIYEKVSTLRNLFTKLHAPLKERRGTQNKVTHTLEEEIKAGGRDKDTSRSDRRPETSRERVRTSHGNFDRQVLPSKLYSEAVAGREENTFKLAPNKSHSLSRRDKETTEDEHKPKGTQRGYLGTQNTEGRQNTHRSREHDRNRDTTRKDTGKCGIELETNIQKLRNPRLVILNTPKDITLENVKETLIQQNTELNLKEGIILPKIQLHNKERIQTSGNRGRLKQ